MIRAFSHARKRPARDLASLADESSIFGGSVAAKLERLQAELEPLSCRYDVVVANPPYMGSSSLGKWMGAWVKKRYPEAYRDLCTSFIDRGFILSAEDGYSAMVTMQSWMFLGSFEKLRGKILHNHSISSMAHLGTRAFGAIAGEVVSTTATVFTNAKSEFRGAYFRLVDMCSEEEKQAGLLEALADPDCGWFYRADADGFSAIPGSPIAYWASRAMLSAFSHARLSEFAMRICKGCFTGNNEKFLRYWHEVSHEGISEDNWHLYSKGGAFRRWYGNTEHVIKWKNAGAELKAFPKSGMGPSKYYGMPHFVWSGLTSGAPSFRSESDGVFFDDVAPALIFKEDKPLSLLAFLNSSVVTEMLSFIAPTLHFQAGDIKQLPVIDKVMTVDASYALNAIKLAKSDWDSFEASWDFKCHPLV